MRNKELIRNEQGVPRCAGHVCLNEENFVGEYSAKASTDRAEGGPDSKSYE